MNVRITALGNEGFDVFVDGISVLFDPFFRALPGVAPKPWRSPSETKAAHIILITHSHWDHFNDQAVVEAAQKTGAKVGGPASVVGKLRGRIPDANLIELEPHAKDGHRTGVETTVHVTVSRYQCSPLAGDPQMTARITAFRTFHSRDHNSYLVDIRGFRMFHDGDNEDTRPLDLTTLRPLDALFIGPWQGSGWVEFVEALQPRKWFLMHLDENELDQHEKGKYLPELCDHVPPNLVVLRPGQSFEM
ncbi:MAG: MBL fold metallo-hydrolase [Kiritimatiellae bacterium]|nr:MBL fold metallo-hydrolase [Kiritimatiellia bacterium]